MRSSGGRERACRSCCRRFGGGAVGGVAGRFAGAVRAQRDRGARLAVPGGEPGGGGRARRQCRPAGPSSTSAVGSKRTCPRPEGGIRGGSENHDVPQVDPPPMPPRGLEPAQPNSAARTASSILSVLLVLAAAHSSTKIDCPRSTGYCRLKNIVNIISVAMHISSNLKWEKASRDCIIQRPCSVTSRYEAVVSNS